jgi:hypothetical protein
MRTTILSFALALFFIPATAQAQEGKLLSYWVQLGQGGAVEARAIVGGTTCPTIELNTGAALPMSTRAQSDQNFMLACEATIPAGTAQARIERANLSASDELLGQVTNDPSAGKPAMHPGWVLPLPIPDPQRILVLGDTGCRIKPPALQDCSDITKWPFPELAASAAKLKPDLVIHVGDYLYRESPCPTGVTGCAGTPWGDNWPTWAADFFSPAQPLLASAPWVIVRGNHEDCARSGPGFLRLLGPTAFDPAAACNPHLTPFSVPAGTMNLVVFDDSNASDTSKDDASIASYQQDFAALATIAPKPQWLLMHRPIWAAIKGPLGIPIGGNIVMINAAGDLSAFASVELMLAGHIHSFEAINYKQKIPPQIVAGHGGDNLDPTPSDLSGTTFQGHSGVRVSDGLSVGGFGFLLMTKNATGWTIDLYKVDGTTEGQCQFSGGRIDCKPEAQ